MSRDYSAPCAPEVSSASIATKIISAATTTAMDVGLFVALAAGARLYLSMGQASSSSQQQPAAPLLLEPALRGDLAAIRALVEKAAEQATKNATAADDNGDGEPAVANTNAVASLIHQVDAGGNTALHGAVFGGHLDVVRYLLEEQEAASQLLTRRNGLGCTSVWLAAGYNRAAILDYLLQQNTNGSRSMSEALLSVNNTGDSPLLAAASRGHAALCLQLLQYADDCGCTKELATLTNDSGDSALSVAIASEINDAALLDRLIHHSETIVHLANTQGLTPLLIACERDHAAAAQKMLACIDQQQAASFLEVVDPVHGHAPLGVAAFCGSTRVLQLLLQQQPAIIPMVDRASATTGCTPLWLAVKAGHVDCARLLLEAGADPTQANRQGVTPLAAASQRPEMVQLLQQSATTTTTTGS